MIFIILLVGFVKIGKMILKQERRYAGFAREIFYKET